MNKKRILFTGEASFLSTGFATYNREILNRLHATGKYIIAEMGSYAHASDPRCKDLPWKFYPVLPNNQNEKQIYESNPTNAFGGYKLDAVLADFQPDIVFDARDPWMFQHLVSTKLRDNFKLILVPTVDSAPQKKEWVEGLFKKADVLGTYSRYGKRVLEQDGCKVAMVASPGINLEVFYPKDKLEVRDKFHITPSLFIFGTVMRNQKRKLFPDLFAAYSKLRNKYAAPKLVQRAKAKHEKEQSLSKEERAALRIDHSALYCHTSFPDLGWDIPDYLWRFSLQRHVIFTYKCDSCKAVYAAWFTPCDKKGMVICRECGQRSAHMPNTHSGVDEVDLVNVFNLFDAYIQPAICEGWGLPIVEAKACGVPGMYQNYSAMEDHVQNGGGIPIKVDRFYHEAETSAVRSLPDIDDMVDKMLKFATDDDFRTKLASEAREVSERMHSWDITAKKVEEVLDSTEILDRQKTWGRPAYYKFISETLPPQNLSDEEFVVWAYMNILGRMPDEDGFNNWIGQLKAKAPREKIIDYFRTTVNDENMLEEVRWKNYLKMNGLPQDNFQDVHVLTAPSRPGEIL